ncbi:MAG: hypothetical protein P1U56_16140 [Saprospiraceae bacterium]|nr:hypothetical protein [Saprospiraceae bacterium]
MAYKSFIFFFILILIACQSDPPSGNEIVFGDVIGNYIGECADYDSSTSEMMNREDATLTVFAVSTDMAGINTSCDRILDQDLLVKSASAAQIVFEKNSGTTQVIMTYFAAFDSIAIVQNEDGMSKDLIFTGIRD